MDPWEISVAAWHRPIGDYPAGATGFCPQMDESGPAQCRTKRGIPLGGIGTGSFMLNLAGSFGPWEFSHGDDSPGARWGSELASGHEERFLPEAAFHVFLRRASSTEPTVKTLATEDVLPSWPVIEKGQGMYHALFPKGWFVYEGLEIPVIMKYFSPFVARDYRLSSLPVATFQFLAHNTTDEMVDVAFMFTYPNAKYREDTPGYAYTRTGLRVAFEETTRESGVRLQAEDTANIAVTQRTEWAIAARCQHGGAAISCADWCAVDGSDILNVFSRDGVLPDEPLDPRTHGQAGAVAIKRTLEPGEEAVFQFVLAWDFPLVQFPNPVNGTQWLKRYKEWFPGKYRAWDIATEVLQDLASIEQALDEWWLKIVDEPAYPDWLKCGALNELYYDLFGGVFWESACVSKAKQFGGREGQHLYFSLEANVYRDAETLDVRHYETRHLLVLFPAIERDVLLAWIDFVNADPDGRVPHDAGSPMNDPFFAYGQYASTSPGTQPRHNVWKDLQCMFVQQIHAFWHYTKDQQFLEEAYGAAEKAMKFLEGCDVDKNGLPEHGGVDTGYDAFQFQGTSTYVAGLYITALEAMANMSTGMQKPREAGKYRAMARTARAWVEKHLWSENGHYLLDSDGPLSKCIQADALNGQRYAETSHLPDAFTREHIESHMKAVLEHNFRNIEDGKYGALNMVGQDDETVPNHMAMGVWPGGTYFTAATMYHAGKISHDQELIDGALSMAKNVHDFTFHDDQAAFWFNTPAFWFPETPPEYRSLQNMRPRSIWELLLEIKDPFHESS